MGIEIALDKGLSHARVEGELTVYTTSEYRRILLTNCDISAGMTIDLGAVTEIDISGLQLLLVLRRHLEGTEIGIQLINPSKVVEEILKLTGLTKTFEEKSGKLQ